VGASSASSEGAKIIGALTIGDGANALILESVPATLTVVGIPAKVVRKSERKPSNLEETKKKGKFR
jgi:serine O-acetyltransferase